MDPLLVAPLPRVASRTLTLEEVLFRWDLGDEHLPGDPKPRTSIEVLRWDSMCFEYGADYINAVDREDLERWRSVESPAVQGRVWLFDPSWEPYRLSSMPSEMDIHG